MKAEATRIKDIIEGTKQYNVPIFQRTYSWDKEKWEILWEDITELYQRPRTHFFGPIVTMPDGPTPEGISKFLLVDGQQRLTTLFIILTLIRDKSREKDKNFAEEINNTLLINPFKKGDDFYKLTPTKFDIDIFRNLINNNYKNTDNQMISAYNFFSERLNNYDIESLKKIKEIIVNYLSLVSITLGPEDDPNLVYEGLNFKGMTLAKGDLIRNYLFMCMPKDMQDNSYNEFWIPMQNALEENLTDFIRHYLMIKGSNVRDKDIYYIFKENVHRNNAVEYLKVLYRYSNYYKKLLNPELENDKEIRVCLERLNRIEVTTAYPLLLNFYDYYNNSKINKNNFLDLLKILENYLIRRYICRISTKSLNKIFLSIISQLDPNNIIESFKISIASKDYPKDEELKKELKELNYASSDIFRMILDSFEDYYAHREKVYYADLTIEHVMPQELTDWWKNHLGEDWKNVHENYVHTIGNLTITGYNTKLSNKDFFSKKEHFRNDHLEMNKYFGNLERWNKDEIEKRTEYLANITTKIWPYIGSDTNKKYEAIHNTSTDFQQRIKPDTDTKSVGTDDIDNIKFHSEMLDHFFSVYELVLQGKECSDAIKIVAKHKGISEGSVHQGVCLGRYDSKNGNPRYKPHIDYDEMKDLMKPFNFSKLERRLQDRFPEDIPAIKRKFDILAKKYALVRES